MIIVNVITFITIIKGVLMDLLNFIIAIRYFLKWDSNNFDVHP